MRIIGVNICEKFGAKFAALYVFVYATLIGSRAGNGISFHGGFMNDDAQTQEQDQGGSGDTPIVILDGKTDQTQQAPAPTSDQ